ncbi:MAG: nitroreductase family protein [Verrucomicrobiota bacterium JB022]|nr:nitroreductase family protein [Verrucomicrobiota bacterium JB022]
MRRQILKLFRRLGFFHTRIAGRNVFWKRRGDEKLYVNALRDAEVYQRHAIFSLDDLGEEQCLSRLTMLAHGIEKALSLSAVKKPFFLAKFPILIQLAAKVVDNGWNTGDERFIMAQDAAVAYFKFHEGSPEVDAFREEAQRVFGNLETFTQSPLIELMPAESVVSFQDFKAFCHSRHSVRSFSDQTVPREDLTSAIELALRTPSVCNRQPWKVKILDEREEIASAFKLQNGNTGFGHEVRTLLLTGADMRSFLGPEERNEPWIDAGMFSMSLVYALHAKGISSCTLNWCVDAERDAQLRKLLGLPEWFRVTMFICVGYPREGASVAASRRRQLNDFIL